MTKSPFFGRQGELAVLSQYFCDTKCSRYCLISGDPGIGKTRLYSEVVERYRQQGHQFLEGRGKFLQNDQKQIFSAIKDVFLSLLSQYKKNAPEEFEIFKASLLARISQHSLISLLPVIPAIRFIIGEEILVTSKDNGTKLQLAVICNLARTILEEISKRTNLLIFIDDLQWCDTYSFSFLKSLISKSDLPNLLIYFTYRSKDILAKEDLFKEIERIKHLGNVISIEIGPLDHDAIGSWVSQLHFLDSERTQQVVQEMESKTHGNPLFIASIISNFVNIGQEKSYESLLTQIKATKQTDNVADFFVSEINKLDLKKLSILKPIALLFNRLELRYLDTFLQCFLSSPFERAQEELLKSGYLHQTSSGVVIAHDKIQEAIVATIPPTELNFYYLKLARFFADKSPLQSIKYYMHVKESFSSDEIQRIRKLGYEAALKVKDSVANKQVIEILEYALSLSESKMWSTDHPFAAKYFSLYCDALYGIGDIAKAEAVFDEVVRNTTHLRDQWSVYLSKINAYIYKKRATEGTEIALNILRRNGIQMPKYFLKISTLLLLLRVVLILNFKSMKKLLSMPALTDDRDAAISKIFKVLIVSSYIAAPKYFASGVLKLLLFSLNRGYSPVTPYAFVSFAVLLVKLRQHNLAYRYGRIALDYLERYPDSETAGQVYFIFYSMVLHWQSDYYGNRDICYKAIELNRIHSDQVMMASAISNIIYMQFAMGRPLLEVQEHQDKYRELFRELHQHKSYASFRVWDQVAVDLDGAYRNDFILGDIDGATFSFKRDSDYLTDTVENRTTLETYCFAKLYRLVLFHQFDRAISLVPFADRFTGANIGLIHSAEYLYLKLLSYFGAIVQAGKCIPAYKRVVKSVMNTYIKICDGAPANYEHRKLFLIALKKFCKERTIDVVGLEKALNIALMKGNYMDASRILEFWAMMEKNAEHYLFSSELLVKAKIIAQDAHWKAKGEFLDSSDCTLNSVQPNSLTSIVQRKFEIMDQLSLQNISGNLFECTLHFLQIFKQRIEPIRCYVFYRRKEHLQLIGHLERGFSPVLFPEGPPLSKTSHLPMERIEKAYLNDKRDIEPPRETITYTSFVIPLSKDEDVRGVIYFELEGSLILSQEMEQFIQIFYGVMITKDMMLELQSEVRKREMIEADLLDYQKKLQELIAVSSRELTASKEELTYKDRVVTKTEEENRQLQETLFNSAKLASLGEMAAGIAHEINNPLAIIQGRTQLALKKIKAGLTSSSVEAELEKIAATVHRIAKILTGLKRLAHGGGEVTKQVSLSLVLDDVLSICAEKYRSEAISLFTNFSPTTSHIQVDEVQMPQVLINLLNNAHDAVKTSPEKWIEISTVDLPDQFQILIIDSGPGIPKDIKAKIFDPFFSTKDIGKGTGIGLSISQKIIADHGGRLELLESSINTTFQIVLPKQKNLL